MSGARLSRVTSKDKKITLVLVYVVTLAGGAILWTSKKQPIVALSTAEAEYVAACEVTMEAVSERNVISEVLPTVNM